MVATFVCRAVSAYRSRPARPFMPTCRSRHPRPRSRSRARRSRVLRHPAPRRAGRRVRARRLGLDDRCRAGPARRRAAPADRYGAPAAASPGAPPSTRARDDDEDRGREGRADRALQRLPEGTRFDVIFFDGGSRRSRPIVALDGPRATLIDFVTASSRRLDRAAPAMRPAVSGAPRRAALRRSRQCRRRRRRRATRCARGDPRGGTRFDAVGLGAGQDASLLGTLAGESGGLYQAL